MRRFEHGEVINGGVLKWSTTSPYKGPKRKKGQGYIGTVGRALIDAEKVSQARKVLQAFKASELIGAMPRNATAASAMRRVAKAGRK